MFSTFMYIYIHLNIPIIMCLCLCVYPQDDWASITCVSIYNTVYKRHDCVRVYTLNMCNTLHMRSCVVIELILCI